MNVLWKKTMPTIYFSMPSTNPEFQRMAFFRSRKMYYKYFNSDTPRLDMVGMHFKVEEA